MTHEFTTELERQRALGALQQADHLASVVVTPVHGQPLPMTMRATDEPPARRPATARKTARRRSR